MRDIIIYLLYSYDSGSCVAGGVDLGIKLGRKTGILGVRNLCFGDAR